MAAGDSCCDVAAALIGESGPADLDGARWAFVATDGRRIVTVEAGIGGSQFGYRGMPVDEGELERAVERFASNLARETRLAELAARSPLPLDL